MSLRKRYTKPFKEEALPLVSQEGVSLSQVAKDLGLDASMLRRWRKKASKEGFKAFRGHGYAHDEEVAKLKSELGRVKRERGFLKDAAAYFAKFWRRASASFPSLTHLSTKLGEDHLEREIGECVIHYNTRRYQESLNNLTPEDVWCGRGQSVLGHRRKIKEQTVQLRKRVYMESQTAYHESAEPEHHRSF